MPVWELGTLCAIVDYTLPPISFLWTIWRKKVGEREWKKRSWLFRGSGRFFSVRWRNYFNHRNFCIRWKIPRRTTTTEQIYIILIRRKAPFQSDKWRTSAIHIYSCKNRSNNWHNGIREFYADFIVAFERYTSYWLRHDVLWSQGIPNFHYSVVLPFVGSDFILSSSSISS